ncbi:MAG: hypothetical protein U0174_01100 [Polyangiaceae bacterium]
MDCLELISNLSPRLERAVDLLVEVETAASEIQRTSRGKTFLVRGRIHWTGLLAMHRALYEDAFFIFDALGEALESHHHDDWANWRRSVAQRDVVLESLLPDAGPADDDDGDKNRIHRRWKSDRVGSMRSSVLKRMFGEGETPLPLRQRVEELAGRLHMQRGGRAASHTFAPGVPRTCGAGSFLSTGAVRVALGFLTATFNDISVLTNGVVRTYPGPANRETLETEARLLTDSILLGDSDQLQRIRLAAVQALNLSIETPWSKLREPYYQAIHTAHDDGGADSSFLFNDVDVELRVVLRLPLRSAPPASR